MNNDSLKLIKNNLDKLPLTLHGTVKLAVYPVEVVNYIISKPLKLEADDLFGYMTGIARNYCKQNGLADPTWTLCNKLIDELEVRNQPLIDADALEILVKNQKPKSKPKSMSHNNQKTSTSIQKPIREIEFGSTCDKWGNKRPETVEEFMQVRRDVVAYFDKELANGNEPHLYAQIVYNAFKKDIMLPAEILLDRPANPLFADGPKMRDVMKPVNVIVEPELCVTPTIPSKQTVEDLLVSEDLPFEPELSSTELDVLFRH